MPASSASSASVETSACMEMDTVTTDLPMIKPQGGSVPPGRKPQGGLPSLLQLCLPGKHPARCG